MLLADSKFFVFSFFNIELLFDQRRHHDWTNDGFITSALLLAWFYISISSSVLRGWGSNRLTYTCLMGMCLSFSVHLGQFWLWWFYFHCSDCSRCLDWRRLLEGNDALSRSADHFLSFILVFWGSIWMFAYPFLSHSVSNTHMYTHRSFSLTFKCKSMCTRVCWTSARCDTQIRPNERKGRARKYFLRFLVVFCAMPIRKRDVLIFSRLVDRTHLTNAQGERKKCLRSVSIYL